MTLNCLSHKNGGDDEDGAANRCIADGAWRGLWTAVERTGHHGRFGSHGQRAMARLPMARHTAEERWQSGSRSARTENTGRQAGLLRRVGPGRRPVALLDRGRSEIRLRQTDRPEDPGGARCQPAVRRSDRSLSSGGSALQPLRRVPQEDRTDTGAHHRARGGYELSADLHGWKAAAKGSEPELHGLLRWTMGRRHARHRLSWLQGTHVARLGRTSAQREAAPH